MALRFSIIVPTLNRRPMLRDAIASVRAQCWDEVEIIVVDGGSTDGTLDDMRAEHDIRLISEPDRGVYDAFNKGIACASGDVVGILNSDDYYEPGAFAAVAEKFAPNVHSVCGTSLVVDGDQVVEVFDDEAAKELASPRVTLIGSCTPNARFFRRDAMARIGPFSLDYKYVSDRDWLTRWYEAGLLTATVPQIVYRYRQHPGSLTFDADRRREVSIREDLIWLARRWRDDVGASAETRRMATLLEGRSVATLAAHALREGRWASLLRRLFEREGRLSIAPVACMLIAGIDWTAQVARRRTR